MNQPKMAVVALAPGGNPKLPEVRYTEQGLQELAEQLTKLRDDVASGTHPRLKLPKQVNGQPEQLITTKFSSAASHPLSNGTAKGLSTSTQSTSQLPIALPPKPSPISHPPISRSHYNRDIPASIPGSSGIDPIFLQKSDVLVKAEISQKRSRIERVLEDQLHQKHVVSRQRLADQEALPDFNVTEVLRKAQDLVKPIKVFEGSAADNKAASSTDSFDDNTFYSSQMNESTTTEEVDGSRKWRPHKLCKFFVRREACRYGDSCTFSHDPALKQRVEADGSVAMDLDSVNADEHTSSRHNSLPPQALTNGAQPPPPKINSNVAISTGPTAQEERIAQLEEQLRALKEQSMKAQQPAKSDAVAHQQPRETFESQEESAYSPPGPDEFGRDAGLRELDARQPQDLRRPPSPKNVHPPAGEYVRRGDVPPPSSNDMRVIRNHITSPFAPQPARVSPLAVAKVPQVAQLQRNEGENRRPSRLSNAEVVSAEQSPSVPLQTLSSRKRRRAPDANEQARNVIPRRHSGSPEIRIKEEPQSPPPFNGTTEIRQIRRRLEAQPLYVNTGAPQGRPQERVVYQPRNAERPSHAYDFEDRAPITPVARRMISRNGQHYVANEDQDLRRVVSARQVRAPMSPAPYPAQYSDPQPRMVRPASQVYISPTAQGAPPQYGASVQPQSATYIPRDRSPSPPRRMEQSSYGRQSISMAPPLRRIVVDQYGNQFMEAPLAPGKQPPAAPISRRQEFDTRYEQLPPPPRSASVRQPEIVNVDDEVQYIRKVQSPAPPPFYEVPPPTRTRQENGAEGQVYGDRALRDENVRILEYPSGRTVSRYDEGVAPREGMVRMQSVRPVSDQFEVSQERTHGVQSVRPQQPRIVNLNERQVVPQQRIVNLSERQEMPQQRIVNLSERPEMPQQRIVNLSERQEIPQQRIVNLSERQQMPRQVVRQISVRPEDRYARQVSYVPEEQPRYQYVAPVQEGGRYAEEIQDNSRLYEAPGSDGRRVLERM